MPAANLEPKFTTGADVLALPALLTVRDVQARCRVGRDRAYQIAAACGVRLGRSLRVRPADLEFYLRELRVAQRGGRLQ